MGFSSKDVGVCCHSLLQRIFPNQGLNLVLHIAGRFFTIWASSSEGRITAQGMVLVFVLGRRAVVKRSLTCFLCPGRADRDPWQHSWLRPGRCLQAAGSHVCAERDPAALPGFLLLQSALLSAHFGERRSGTSKEKVTVLYSYTSSASPTCSAPFSQSIKDISKI